MADNNKSERFEMRISPSFKELLNKVALKKKMKVPQLIDYLVRREAEKEKINPS